MNNDKKIDVPEPLPDKPEVLNRLSTTTIKELIEIDRNNNYICGNVKVDKRILEFLTMIILLTYCIYQLVANSNRDNSFEISVLSLILGIVSQNLRNNKSSEKQPPK